MPKYKFAPLTTKLTFWLLGHVEKRPKLHAMMQRVAENYNEKQGYRRHGLFKDDLVPDDHPLVQEALRRLTEQELFDRNFRIKRANELHFRHETLPKEAQPTAKDDVRYLRKHMVQILKEEAEEQKYDPK